MANPFLIEDNELPQSTLGFNPFLSSNDFGSSNNASENPFLSSFTADDTISDSNTTNPFSFGEDSSTTDFFGNSNVNYENIFSSPTQNINQVPSNMPHQSDLFLNDTFGREAELCADAKDLASEEYEGQKGVPRRPPPPRPLPPRETTELIRTVTGAMEATSSHLLDRLRATRTPSPTPMRELHSPSPTQFGDLLEVDEPLAPGPPPGPPQAQQINLMDDFDFADSLQETIVPESSAVKAPTSPVAPVTPPPTPAAPASVSEAPPVRPSAALEQAAEDLADTVFVRPEVGSPVEAKPEVPPTIPASSPVAPPSRPAPPSVPVRPKPPQMPARPAPPAVPPVPPAVPHAVPHAVPPSVPPVLSPSVPPAVPHAAPPAVPPIVPPSIPPAVPHAAPPAVPPIVSPSVPPAVPAQPAHPEPQLIQEVPPVVPEPVPSPDIKKDEGFADVFGVHSPQPVDGSGDLFEARFEETTPAFTDRSAFGVFGDAFAAPGPDAFAAPGPDAFAEAPPEPFNAFESSLPTTQDAFDVFAAKFESAAAREQSAAGVSPADAFDPFGGGARGTDDGAGFGVDDSFDAFLALSQPPPVPQGTPARVSRGHSVDSDSGNDFNVIIKPKEEESADSFVTPVALPPPRSPQASLFQDSSPRFNPFDNSQEVAPPVTQNIFAQAVSEEAFKQVERTDSQETPPTPLFDEDVSQPLEEFPRIQYEGPGWEMHLRQPNKKKITGQRFWKKIFVKLVYQGENPVLQLFNGKDDKDPFQELPLQPCYSVSDIGAQQYDQYGKIFTVKLQFIFYKERPGVRPGQVTKAERLTNKLSQFAAYAIQGDYQGVKEFGSDLKKLGLPVEHAPQISQLFKLGSFNFEDMKQLSVTVEEALFKLSAHRDRALNYKMEEVQITAVDELYVDQNSTGAVLKQIARVRLFFLGFLSGMPDVELGVNDLVRQGKEVVGRHDIIPVVTEEWIRLEHVEFHSCIQQDEYERTKTIKFKPPDACYIELMRFRVRPPRNRELPLQLKVVMCITGNKVELRGDILVPGFTSRKLGQIPCEDIMVRFPIPECWIYLFRVEKHFRYGSVKSAHRRTGKVKGIERFLGAVDNMEPSLMEVTSGQAKYEHQHRAIVWRIPRLPKEGQGAYTTHNFVCRMALTSYDQIPEELSKYCYVEFTMPATTVSHMTVRSVSISNSDSDNPPEKYVRQLSRHEYRVEIEQTQGEGPGDYLAVAKTAPPPPPVEPAPPPVPAQPDSDSDSSG